jgi:hypothetical protein
MSHKVLTPPAEPNATGWSPAPADRTRTETGVLYQLTGLAWALSKPLAHCAYRNWADVETAPELNERRINEN